jgi:RES domain-containing protein
VEPNWNSSHLRGTIGLIGPSRSSRHYSVLPKDYVLTEIQMPENLSLLRVEEENLPDNWDSEPALSATQQIGKQWVSEDHSVALSVPSSVIPGERNFVLNPAHPEFEQIIFTQPVPFRFDPRLKK